MTTAYSSLFTEQIADHAQTLAKLHQVAPNFEQLCQTAIATLEAGGKILFFGNGGSAADAQHLATELTVRYRVNRRALASVALTTDSSALTAIGNDFGFEEVFSRQVEAIGRSGDLVIGITTSGSSPNVVKGLQAARAGGMFTVAFTGYAGTADGVADLTIAVPSSVTARVQEMHILIGHSLCEAIESNFA